MRDGVHFIKVYDKLPIKPYLKMTVFEKYVSLPENASHWTPTLFTTAANNFFKIKQIANSIAYCGLVCKLCHFADSCDGCRSEKSCCGLRKTAEDCYQYNCCTEKGVDGCWQCDVAPCDKGMFSVSHDVRLRAFIKYIKENGKDKLAERLYFNMQNGIYYGHGKDYDGIGSIDEVIKKLEG